MQIGRGQNGPIEAPLVRNSLLDSPEHWAVLDGPDWPNFSVGRLGLSIDLFQTGTALLCSDPPFFSYIASLVWINMIGKKRLISFGLSSFWGASPPRLAPPMKAR